MNFSTKERLVETAATLFAEHGYRGASVRRICDMARANPGAISYHFGGKKQLYRMVLRRAASTLSDFSTEDVDVGEDARPLSIAEVLDRIFDQLDARPADARLLLRDLADGGEIAVEALEPTIRAAFEGLRLAIGEDSAPRGSATGRTLFLDLAAPVFLLTGAWPVLQRALDLDPDQRRAILLDAIRRALEAHGYGDLG